jgi:hypothetical protein
MFGRAGVQFANAASAAGFSGFENGDILQSGPG